MKRIAVEKTNLDVCITRAQSEKIVVTRDGAPVALIVGLEGLDAEQIALGSSDKFWKLIRARRKEKTICRAELEVKLKRHGSR